MASNTSKEILGEGKAVSMMRRTGYMKLPRMPGSGAHLHLGMLLRADNINPRERMLFLGERVLADVSELSIFMGVDGKVVESFME